MDVTHRSVTDMSVIINNKIYTVIDFHYKGIFREKFRGIKGKVLT